MPFDSNFLPNFHDTSNPFDFTPALLPVDFDTTSRLDMNPFELDRTLESPLGLGFDSPFSDQFLASPMFSTDLTMPFDSPAIDYTSLFAVVPPPVPATVPTAAPTKSTKPTKTKAKTPKPALLPLDAPVQPRNYVTPSATSRKRKTVPVERELIKRAKSFTSTPSTSSTPSLPAAVIADTDELPADLVSAVEKKRLLNTISARKSRMRKQSQLLELQEANEALVLENEELKRRIAELEAKFGRH